MPLFSAPKMNGVSLMNSKPCSNMPYLNDLATLTITFHLPNNLMITNQVCCSRETLGRETQILLMTV